MPSTVNRGFRNGPRVITTARGHYYGTADGSRFCDLFSGLWTTGASHYHLRIVEAVQRQVAEVDFAMTIKVA